MPAGSTQADGLDVIAPDPTAVVFSGKAYAVEPLRIGQLPAFARAIRPLSGAIDGLLAQGLTAAGLLDLVAEHGEQVIEALAVATKVPADVIAQGDPADLVPAMLRVFQVNRDFLMGRLSPALQAAAQAM